MSPDMEPRIQYAKTSDGVSIAYTTYGEGSPVVWSHQPIASHVQLEWEIPLFRAIYSALASVGMLVRFDTRGVGLSDRNVANLSVEARVTDLQTVVDHLELEQFSLIGVAAALAQRQRPAPPRTGVGGVAPAGRDGVDPDVGTTAEGAGSGHLSSLGRRASIFRGHNRARSQGYEHVSDPHPCEGKKGRAPDGLRPGVSKEQDKSTEQ